MDFAIELLERHLHYEKIDSYPTGNRSIKTAEKHKKNYEDIKKALEILKV